MWFLVRQLGDRREVRFIIVLVGFTPSRVSALFVVGVCRGVLLCRGGLLRPCIHILLELVTTFACMTSLLLVMKMICRRKFPLSDISIRRLGVLCGTI